MKLASTEYQLCMFSWLFRIGLPLPVDDGQSPSLKSRYSADLG
jgi:hypothetical protein